MFLTVSSREKVLGAPVLIVQQCVDKGGWGSVCVWGGGPMSDQVNI